MNKNSLKILGISLLITVASLIFFGFPYIKDFGVTSLVEESHVNFDRTVYFNTPILKGQKITAKFKASENNFGILLVRFIKFGKGNDTVIFRLKKEGDKNWHYENRYVGENIQNGKYFPFGFPLFINSKNESYIFELESIAGTDENGIGVSDIKPQIALVYNYSIQDLSNPSQLSTFLSKKIIYITKSIDYLPLAFIVGLSMILLHFKKEIKGIIKDFRRNPKKTYQRLVKRFISTKLYQIFLNTDFKKRFIITLMLFIIALIYRIAASLVSTEELFYSVLGGQGDYDQFMRASTCALNFCSWILHQNLLIESLILGSFYQFFGFTGGLKAYVYLMLIVSSIVATFPYLLLSRKTWFSIGGIMGSLLLANSDFLTIVALHFPPDNGSIFIFSMFYIVYLFTMHYGTSRWLFALGLTAFLDGMFKAFFLINDVAALALFVPVFFYEKTRSTTLPLSKQLRVLLKRKNIKIFLLALLPILSFLILYSAWEYFVQIKFSAPYFLRGLIETGGAYFRFETIFYNRNSGEAEQNLILQLFYLLISGLVMIKRMISLSDLQVIYLSPIFLGLLYFSFIQSPLKAGLPLAKRFKVKLSSIKLGMVLIFSFVTIALLVSIKNNYLGIHQVFLGEYIHANWTLETYISIFLFVEIIFLCILNFKYQAFRFALPILPYVIMLIILTKNAPWERILVHPIVWNIILLSFLVDWMLRKLKKDSALKRVWIGSLLLAVFIFFYTIPKQASMVEKLYAGINNYRNEVTYLRWVNSELPENAIILAGGKSDLAILGENIHKPIVYNTLWSTSLLIRPNRIPGVTPGDFNIVVELKNKNNFKKNKYVILEDDIYLWRNRIAGVDDNLFATASATYLNADDYAIKVYKTNQERNSMIYELKSKDKK